MFKKVHLIPSLILAGLLIGLVVIAVFHYKDSSGIPRGVLKDANFSIYYPKDRKGLWAADAATIKLNTSEQLLSFSLKRDGNKVSMSEQPTPGSFADAPQVLLSFLQFLLLALDRLVEHVRSVVNRTGKALAFALAALIPNHIKYDGADCSVIT